MTRPIKFQSNEPPKTPAVTDSLADDRAWDEKFARSQDQLARLADLARAEVGAGRVRPRFPFAW